MILPFTMLLRPRGMTMAATDTDATVKPNYDPVALADSYASAADKSAKLLGDYLSRQGRGGHSMLADEFGLTKHTKKNVFSFTRQYIDALAPSNFALTNPEVFRETISTGGQNLVKGLNNLLDDIERGNGQLRISMTDSKAFELGVNIATTL